MCLLYILAWQSDTLTTFKDRNLARWSNSFQHVVSFRLHADEDKAYYYFINKAPLICTNCLSNKYFRGRIANTFESCLFWLPIRCALLSFGLWPITITLPKVLFAPALHTSCLLPPRRKTRTPRVKADQQIFVPLLTFKFTAENWSKHAQNVDERLHSWSPGKSDNSLNLMTS